MREVVGVPSREAAAQVFGSITLVPVARVPFPTLAGIDGRFDQLRAVVWAGDAILEAKFMEPDILMIAYYPLRAVKLVARQRSQISACCWPECNQYDDDRSKNETGIQGGRAPPSCFHRADWCRDDYPL